MSNFFVPEPKELVSESIKESLPEEQDYQKIYQESCISVLFQFEEGSMQGLFGSLIGIEISESVKIDARIATDEAFDLIQSLSATSSGRTVKNVALNYDDKITKLRGPYRLNNTKIIEFDVNNKTCVLAIDLIKTSLEKK